MSKYWTFWTLSATVWLLNAEIIQVKTFYCHLCYQKKSLQPLWLLWRKVKLRCCVTPGRMWRWRHFPFAWTIPLMELVPWQSYSLPLTNKEKQRRENKNKMLCGWMLLLGVNNMSVPADPLSLSSSLPQSIHLHALTHMEALIESVLIQMVWNWTKNTYIHTK